MESQGEFAERKIQVIDNTKRFTFLKNTVHISQSTQSNQNRQKELNFTVCCTEGVKSILAVKWLRLSQTSILFFAKFASTDTET